jgi:hypothetical protein
VRHSSRGRAPHRDGERTVALGIGYRDLAKLANAIAIEHDLTATTYLSPTAEETATFANA